LSDGGGSYGGPLIEITPRTRAGACTAIHKESAAPIDAPPHTAAFTPTPSSQGPRSSAFFAYV
jgi:hypothetical protein